jgi:hypothetical protein
MLVPDLNNNGRWHYIASDAQVKIAMRDKDATIIEVPWLNMTFFISRKYLVTMRAGAAGGDVFSIEGGWVYATDLQQRADEQELRRLSEIKFGSRH